MRGPRPTEGLVERSYRSDCAPVYGRLGYPVVTPSFHNSYSLSVYCTICLYTYGVYEK